HSQHNKPFLLPLLPIFLLFFFFHATTTPDIYTLSLHDALPISLPRGRRDHRADVGPLSRGRGRVARRVLLPHPVRHARHDEVVRSEEHTSELQSRGHLVCRLLLEKKKCTDLDFRGADL